MRRHQLFGIEPGQHEAIDGGSNPRLVGHGRERGLLRGDVGPVLFDGLAGGRPCGGRPLRSLVDPGADEGRLVGGQRFLVERHLVLVALPEDALDEVALRAVAGHEQGPGGAALQRQVADVQAEFAAALLLAVALEALLAEDGLDLRGEVDLGRRLRRGDDVVGQPCRSPGTEGGGKDDDGECEPSEAS